MKNKYKLFLMGLILLLFPITLFYYSLLVATSYSSKYALYNVFKLYLVFSMLTSFVFGTIISKETIKTQDNFIKEIKITSIVILSIIFMFLLQVYLDVYYITLLLFILFVISSIILVNSILIEIFRRYNIYGFTSAVVTFVILITLILISFIV